MRTASAHALFNIGESEKAVPVLEKILSEKNQFHRLRAMNVLDHMDETVVSTIGLDEWCEHQRDDGHELDQNVESRTRGVLKRVTDGVTSDSVFVRCGSLGCRRGK